MDLTGQEPRISVVMPHLDDLANLDACLAHLAAQRMPPERYEVIVADNGSRAGLAAVEAVAAGRARVVAAPERGAGPARNAGVAAARGAILAFIDSDCRPSPDWLVAGEAALAADGAAWSDRAGSDVVGGAVRVIAADAAAPSAVEAYELVFAFRNDLYVRRKGFTVTANMFVSRAVFAAVGPFANGVSEDVEWCHRARALGFRLGYAPACIVAHPARRSWDELARKWRRTTREAHALAPVGLLGALRWLARAWLVLLSALPQSWRILRSSDLPARRTRLGAVMVLLRIRGFRFAEAHRLAFGLSQEVVR
ncbi:glycosyltransferase family 2 protein [Methylobacterium radiodurans]|nr:glycosyltransferase [Methylobacterium radiodurans]